MMRSSSLTIISTIMLSAVVTVALCGNANARDYYVDKGGRDGNDGTELSPWLTVQKAADTARAGDVIYIKKGVYAEQVTIRNSGRLGNPITFKPYPGHVVVMDGTSQAGWHGIVNIHGKSHIRLTGLEIRNNRIGWGLLIEHAIGDNTTPSSFIEVSDLKVHDCADANIEVRGNVNHVTASGLILYNTSRTGGFDITGWSGGRPQYITVHHSVSYGNTGNPGAGFDSEQVDYVTAYGNTVYDSSIGFDIGSGVSNVIRNNLIYNCRNGIDISSNSNSDIHDNTIHDIYDEAFYNYYYSAHGEPHTGNKYYNNVVYNAGFGIYESNQKGTRGGAGPSSGHQYFDNLFYHIGTHGSYRAPFYFKGVTGLKFQNNTIYMNDGYGAIELLNGAASANIKKNIVSFSGKSSPLKIDTTSVTGSSIDFNCYHNRTGQSSGPGTHSILGDPLFSDPSNSDFSPRTGSPCLGIGASGSAVARPPRE